MKQVAATVAPILPTVAATCASFSCRGVCSSPECVTRLMVLPHSLLSPTASTRILPEPSDTCRPHEGARHRRR